MSNEQRMMSFIWDLFDEFYPECGDIDGGTLQDLAEKHGILIPEILHAPCQDDCNCAEMVSDEEWKEGSVCYSLAEWITKNE